MSEERTVLIVDDEPLARRGIRQQLQRHSQYRVVAEAANGRDAVRRIRDFSPDVVFLDISMPLADGFDVVSVIGIANMPAIIFVTAFDQHALRAFDVNAVDYLLKPIDPVRFDEALARAEARRRSEDTQELSQRLARVLNMLEARVDSTQTSSRISIKEGSKVSLIDVDRIDRIEAEGNYLKLWIDGSARRIRETMQEFLDRSRTPAFVRIHRSVVVNRGAVTAVEAFGKGTFVLTLRDGSRVFSSYSYREQVLSLLDT